MLATGYDKEVWGKVADIIGLKKSECTRIELVFSLRDVTVIADHRQRLFGVRRTVVAIGPPRSVDIYLGLLGVFSNIPSGLTSLRIVIEPDEIISAKAEFFLDVNAA